MGEEAQLLVLPPHLRGQRQRNHCNFFNRVLYWGYSWMYTTKKDETDENG